MGVDDRKLETVLKEHITAADVARLRHRRSCSIFEKILQATTRTNHCVAKAIYEGGAGGSLEEDEGSQAGMTSCSMLEADAVQALSLLQSGIIEKSAAEALLSLSNKFESKMEVFENIENSIAGRAEEEENDCDAINVCRDVDMALHEEIPKDCCGYRFKVHYDGTVFSYRTGEIVHGEGQKRVPQIRGVSRHIVKKSLKDKSAYIYRREKVLEVSGEIAESVRPGEFIKIDRKDNMSILKEIRLKYDMFDVPKRHKETPSETNECNEIKKISKEHDYELIEYLEPEETWNKKNPKAQKAIKPKQLLNAKKPKKFSTPSENIQDVIELDMDSLISTNDSLRIEKEHSYNIPRKSESFIQASNITEKYMLFRYNNLFEAMYPNSKLCDIGLWNILDLEDWKSLECGKRLTNLVLDCAMLSIIKENFQNVLSLPCQIDKIDFAKIQLATIVEKTTTKVLTHASLKKSMEISKGLRKN
ncbi:hypothetical protein EVAR_91037_1 [Eumeta japonica]|uniref:Uncharacterized protein n=1 Tax=Eumeta variegata TaxID=151549 RepID=A0A4C1T9N7_EUMVA|nr:hypothetical protein EVAR_91037_1 [Eumeta japonica]